jgi:nucleotide-binding universal stress UspA family protein
MKKILIPVDSSEYSRRALDQGKKIAEAFDSDILLVHVVEEFLMSSGFRIPIPKQGNSRDASEEQDIKEAEEMLQAYKESLGDMKGKVSTEVIEGYPADEIIKLLNGPDVDMAIMGSSGIGSALYRTVLGSITNKVLHNAEKPVLVIP